MRSQSRHKRHEQQQQQQRRRRRRRRRGRGQQSNKQSQEAPALQWLTDKLERKHPFWCKECNELIQNVSLTKCPTKLCNLKFITEEVTARRKEALEKQRLERKQAEEAEAPSKGIDDRGPIAKDAARI